MWLCRTLEVAKQNTSNIVYSTVIIGGGIAGMSAAIYAARKKMSYAFISEELGGQMLSVGKIENYPGIAMTNCIKMSNAFRKQLGHLGVQTQNGLKATRIEPMKDGTFQVHTNGNKSSSSGFRAKTVLIATGARPRKLGVPGEQKYHEKGCHYCAICDGPMYAGKTVAIIGSGNAGLEAAEMLMRIAKKVYVVDVADKLTGHEILCERITKGKNVSVMCGTKTCEIVGNKFVNGIVIEPDIIANAKKQKKQKLSVDGVFIEIGRIPNSDFVKGLLEFDDYGHIVTDKHQETSVKGIYAAGDVTDSGVYQLITAAGDGVKAIINIAKAVGKR